jgi:y4mF family transcriptional regulator
MRQVSDAKTLGVLIKQVRKSQGLTQEQLAAGCGLGRRFVVELERGKATAHIGKIMQVLAALGLTLHLVDRKGDL